MVQEKSDADTTDKQLKLCQKRGAISIAKDYIQLHIGNVFKYFCTKWSSDDRTIEGGID